MTIKHLFTFLITHALKKLKKKYILIPNYNCLVTMSYNEDLKLAIAQFEKYATFEDAYIVLKLVISHNPIAIKTVIDKLSPGNYNLAIERAIEDENLDLLIELLQGARPIVNIIKFLNIAILKNNNKIVKALLGTNIQFTIPTYLDDIDPLINALLAFPSLTDSEEIRKNWAIVFNLLAFGWPVNIRCSLTSEYALHIATRTGNVNAVRKIISRMKKDGLSVNVVCYNGLSALHLAVASNKFSLFIVCLLVHNMSKDALSRKGGNYVKKTIVEILRKNTHFSKEEKNLFLNIFNARICKLND